MVIVDAQVHAYERDHPGRPWTAPLPGPAAVTGEDMVRALDEAGVDAAILVSPYTVYRFDPSYAVEVQASFPERFALVAPVDPRRDDVAQAVAEWSATPGAVGVRLMSDVALDVTDPGLRRVMAAVVDQGLVVCLLGAGRQPQIGELAGAFPDVQFVVDHLGLRQSVERLPDPFADLPAVLALADHPNVSVKLTGVVTLSHEPFPFNDLWDPLARVFDAFGFGRCMWGSDWTRATMQVSYADTVAAFRDTDRLNPGEKAALLGDTLMSVFGVTFSHPPSDTSK